MKKRLKWLIPLILVVLIVVVYNWPVSKTAFEELYSDEPLKDTIIINRSKLSDYSLIDNTWVWNGE